MIISKILFYLGLGIGVIGFFGNVVAVIAMLKTPLGGGPGITFAVNSLLGPLWQGGVLVAVAKILEARSQRPGESIAASSESYLLV